VTRAVLIVEALELAKGGLSVSVAMDAMVFGTVMVRPCLASCVTLENKSGWAFLQCNHPNTGEGRNPT